MGKSTALPVCAKSLEVFLRITGIKAELLQHIGLMLDDLSIGLTQVSLHGKKLGIALMLCCAKLNFGHSYTANMDAIYLGTLNWTSTDNQSIELLRTVSVS